MMEEFIANRCMTQTFSSVFTVDKNEKLIILPSVIAEALNASDLFCYMSTAPSSCQNGKYSVKAHVAS